MQAAHGPDWQTILNWVLGTATGTVSVLAGAVATMWASERQGNRDRIERLEENNRKLEEAHRENIGKLEAKLLSSEAAERACRESYERLIVEFTRLETRMAQIENMRCGLHSDCMQRQSSEVESDQEKHPKK